jgi:glycosyltransferase involved in cell wall biosynthesis
MKARRVLQVTRTVRGGVAVVANHLARGLDRDLYESIVLFDTDKQSDIRKKLSESHIKTIDLGSSRNEQLSHIEKTGRTKNISDIIENRFGKRSRESYLSLKSFYEFMRWHMPRIRLFVRAIRENGIDLVHTHNDLRRGKPEIIAAWITCVPCVSHIHGYPKLTSFDKSCSRFVDSFIHISTDVAKCHLAQGVPRPKSRVIHNGVDMTEFSQSHDSALIRSELGCNLNEILIGIIGRLDWWKGHEYFLEAMSQAAEYIPNIKGVIIGDLETDVSIDLNLNYNNKLHSLVKSLGLEDRVIFTGFRSDIPALISTMDVIVHASSTPEPFGLVVIEGMAAGKPIIATAAGGVLDIIEDTVSGLLVPCKDSRAMAEAIMQIISNQNRAEQIGRAARQRVADKFTIQRQVTVVQELYDAILGLPLR